VRELLTELSRSSELQQTKSIPQTVFPYRKSDMKQNPSNPGRGGLVEQAEREEKEQMTEESSVVPSHQA